MTLLGRSPGYWCATDSSTSLSSIFGVRRIQTIQIHAVSELCLRGWVRGVRMQVALLRQALAHQQQAARAAEARATALENTVAQLQRSNASLERLIRTHHTMEGVAANGDGTPRVAAAGELAQAYQRIAELEQVRQSMPQRVVRRMTICPAPSIWNVRHRVPRRRQGICACERGDLHVWKCFP